jgi:pimeloyl-ACP methyl ester carboxylesterase
MFGSKPYQGLVNSLQQRGFMAEVVPVSSREWWPILLGGDHQWYLQRIDNTLSEMYKKHGSVALVGHSAGGWVARLLLGEDVPYQGQTFPGRRKKVRSLITLGTPHASIEAYPLGYVAQKLAIDQESVMNFRNNGGGGGGAEKISSLAVEIAELEVPARVKGSTLQFTNYFYPDASYLPGVQVVCIAGDAITGAAPAWRDKRQLSLDNKQGDNHHTSEILKYEAAAKITGNDKWIAYEGYKSGCGDGAVPGDGVTPICIAHLPGAENIILPGVWHGPNSGPERPWYGEDVVLDKWVKYLDVGYSAP